MITGSQTLQQFCYGFMKSNGIKMSVTSIALPAGCHVALASALLIRRPQITSRCNLFVTSYD